MVVKGQQPGKVEAVYQFAQGVDDGGDAFLYQLRQLGVGDADVLALYDLLLDVADPAV